MISENLKKILEKQHYGIAGKHSAVQICRWAKKALLDEGFCYKEQFYGIKSHLCCQMSPSIAWCPNKCIHCWRAVEFTQDLKEIENAKKTDNPKEIIEECVKQQRKLLTGFKSNKKINMKKWEEAQNPRQFAISLAGEPTLYPKLAGLIKELRKQKKTSFLVTNGLYPEKIKKLQKYNALPTQIYISLNTPNEKMYQEWHKSQLKDAWKRFNETIELFKKLKGKTRTVVRMTLVKDLNMEKEHVEQYAEIIKKANPDFVEIKGFMSVGFARQRIGYEKMPWHKDIKAFSKKLLKFLPKYKFLDDKKESCVVLLGKSKAKMKIKEKEI